MTKLRPLPLELTPAGGPFDDPALLVAPTNSDTTILFDCGTLHGVKVRDLQKVRWLFLTHLHIDHLIGFDHLLRVRLFSALPLTIYGPPGTAQAIGHRLLGYAWNLTSGSPFTVRVFELSEGAQPGVQFLCHQSFRPEAVPASAETEAPRQGGEVLLSEGLTVTHCPVQHGVPCLAYRLDRRTPPKFSLETAQSLGLTPGPWVRRLVSGGEVQVEVQGVERDRAWLAERLLHPPVEHGLGFLTDTRLEESLAHRLSEFFQGIDVLCCESAYLESEADLAYKNLHMTTTQVADFARRCGVGRLLLFHLSRRHCDRGSSFHLEEARAIFPQTDLLGIYQKSRSEDDDDPHGSEGM